MSRCHMRLYFRMRQIGIVNLWVSRIVMGVHTGQSLRADSFVGMHGLYLFRLATIRSRGGAPHLDVIQGVIIFI